MTTNSDKSLESELKSLRERVAELEKKLEPTESQVAAHPRQTFRYNVLVELENAPTTILCDDLGATIRSIIVDEIESWDWKLPFDFGVDVS